MRQIERSVEVPQDQKVSAELTSDKKEVSAESLKDKKKLSTELTKVCGVRPKQKTAVESAQDIKESFVESAQDQRKRPRSYRKTGKKKSVYGFTARQEGKVCDVTARQTSKKTVRGVTASLMQVELLPDKKKRPRSKRKTRKRVQAGRVYGKTRLWGQPRVVG